MKEMIVFCRHPRFKSWLASISKRLPVSANEIRFASEEDELEALLAKTNKLLLIDGTLEKIEMLLPKAQAQVILLGDVQGATAAEVWHMRQICLDQVQVHAFIAFSRDPEFYLPVLRSALLARDGAEKMNEVKSLSMKLNALVSQNLSELHRIKRLHERLVPLRSEKLKGLSIYSKFAAGESAGGEFFDTVVREREILVLLASSKSYIASSAILGHFEELRTKSDFNLANLEQFVTALSYELKKLQIDEVELLLLSFDMNNMQVQGYNFGETTLWLGDQLINKTNDLAINPMFIEKAEIKLKLNRGDKLLVRSSGLFRNLKDTIYTSEEQWRNFLKTTAAKSPQEFMSELFYQLKKDLKTDFLKTDASAILIEVDKNAILQV